MSENIEEDIDFEFIEEQLRKEQAAIDSRDWWDLTREQMDRISDIEKRKEFSKKYRLFTRECICRLAFHVKSSFKFSHPDKLLTCRNMLEDMVLYYKKRGIEKSQFYDIMADGDITKKY